MCLDVVFIIETLDELVGGIWRGASVHVPAADVGTFLYQSQGYSLYDVFSRQYLLRSKNAGRLSELKMEVARSRRYRLGADGFHPGNRPFRRTSRFDLCNY